MRITFDPGKNDRNLAERGLSFELVADLDWDTALSAEDTRKDYGERRLRVLARLDGRLHVAIITMRGEAIHVISFRRANRRYGDMSKRQDDDRASRPDDENPEWTRKEIRQARPALDVIADVFGAETADSLRRGRGRPVKLDRKVNQTLRLDPDVLEAFRQEGSGWQARINDVLRAHMPKRQG